MTRRSLALYYFTVERDDARRGRSTCYRPRPGDGPGASALIWLDRQAIHLYSRAKRALGISDHLASRVLGYLGERAARTGLVRRRRRPSGGADRR